MIRGFVLLIVLTLIGYFGYMSARMWWTAAEWHQALALEVETPTGVKAGRSVIYVRFGENSEIGPGRWGYSSRTSGEATVVEVAPGQYLFALLQGNDQQLAGYVFPEATRLTQAQKEDAERAGQTDFNYLLRLNHNLAALHAKREIPSHAVVPVLGNPIDPRPLLVRFRDINDPRTVEKVNPDNLAASFGPGFKLKSYTLELLGKDEPVTRGIEKVIPWVINPEFSKNPGWSSLPSFTKSVIMGLYTGTPEEHFK